MRKVDGDIIKYFDDSSNLQLELVYEDGEITQLRFHFDDDDKTISDKVLYVDPRRFKPRYAFSYTRKSIINGIKKIECFSDDEMTSYSLEERTDEFKLTQIFTPEDLLIDERKVFYNERGIPYRIVDWTRGAKGESDSFSDSKIPIFPGFEDASKMTENDWESYSDLINAYYYSDFCEPYSDKEDLPF